MGVYRFKENSVNVYTVSHMGKDLKETLICIFGMDRSKQNYRPSVAGPRSLSSYKNMAHSFQDL